MDDPSRAQAIELIRALRDEMREMTVRLAWLESRHATSYNGRVSEMRRDAATLRSDIQEAQYHIDRLQRRYLSLTSRVGALVRS